ncbi:MAG TPA: hypothetical protein VNZ54_11840 [bacterium]|nr:hypothetical protein [bacterium]
MSAEDGRLSHPAASGVAAAALLAAALLAASSGLGGAGGSLGAAWPPLLGLLGLAWLLGREELAAAWEQPRLLLGLALAAALLYFGLLALTQESAVLGGRRWWWLEDDAMVSMRYAERWAAGQGPTWSDGARVEGYSNFLWTAGMALLHRLGAARPTASAWVLGANGLLLLWTGLATRRLARALGAGPLAAAVAGLACAASYELMAMALSGLESVAVAAVAAEAMAVAAEAKAQGRPLPLAAAAWAGLLPLLRADGALPALLVLAAWLPGRPTARRTALALLLALGPGLAQLCWRHAYYGAWVPNTALLKAGAWPGKYGDAAWKSAGAMARYPLVLAGVVLAGLRKGRAAWLAVLAVLLAYTVWSGADYYPFFRFFAAGLPLFFALGLAGLDATAPFQRRPALLWLALALGLNAAWAGPRFLGAWGTGKERLEVALELPKQVHPGDRVACCLAGAFFYFSDVQGVDLLGICDPVVAASPVDPAIALPGHNHMDLEWSLGTLKPRWVLMELPAAAAGAGDYTITLYNLKLATSPYFRGPYLGQVTRLSETWALFGRAAGT